MTRYIALFRGINVGGNNKLPMKELVAVLEELGLKGIRTYIQSGNVIFLSQKDGAQKLAAAITAAIAKSHGLAPKVLLRDAEQLRSAIKANPFPDAEADGKTLHFNFLECMPPAPDIPRMEELRSATERFQLKGDVLYLHAPDGIGRSRLVANLERLLGVAMTGRNWNTVRKLMDMVADKV